jgi:hypothetical protein
MRKAQANGLKNLSTNCTPECRVGDAAKTVCVEYGGLFQMSSGPLVTSRDRGERTYRYSFSVISARNNPV